ncbi:MAG TPA: CopG family transcriptional regulator [Thermoanaerobaculia bacterium]|nr:CopG family transcriptional regulator [Thermoanaerobaculia bacterium]
MSQVTLYLDTETEEKMKTAAKAAGVSQSRWVADLIREKTAARWPDSIARLAGAWADFPTAEELRAGLGEDVPREPL